MDTRYKREILRQVGQTTFALEQLFEQDLSWLPSQLKLQFGQLCFQSRRMLDKLEEHVHTEGRTTWQEWPAEKETTH
jgi:hypothetical protein